MVIWLTRRKCNLMIMYKTSIFQKILLDTQRKAKKQLDLTTVTLTFQPNI